MAGVYLTDGLESAQNRFLLGAQIPPVHAMYGVDLRGCCHPMLLVEAVRQAAIYLPHHFFAVPLDWRFVFVSLSLQVDEPAALAMTGEPVEAVLDVVPVSAPRHTRTRFSADLDVVVEIAGRACARATVGVLALAPAVYEALRGTRSAAAGDMRVPATGDPVAAAHVGCRRPTDVLLLAPSQADSDAGTWLLALEPEHRDYLDHVSDHVPGMVLLEAFRQAGQLLTAPTHRALSSIEVSFDAFGEFDAPIEISAWPLADPEPGLVRLRASQNGRSLSQATLRHAPPGCLTDDLVPVSGVHGADPA